MPVNMAISPSSLVGTLPREAIAGHVANVVGGPRVNCARARKGLSSAPHGSRRLPGRSTHRRHATLGIHAASLARRRVANATTILVTCYNTYNSYIFRTSP